MVELTINPLSVEQKQHLGRIAAKLFLDITTRWRVTDAQKAILAGVATRTSISTWRQRVKQKQVLQLGQDTYERIECLQAIDNYLIELSQKQSCTVEFLLHSPRLSLFDESLLSTMLNGKVIDLYTVLEYVKSNQYSIADTSNNNNKKGDQGRLSITH